MARLKTTTQLLEKTSVLFDSTGHTISAGVAEGADQSTYNYRRPLHYYNFNQPFPVLFPESDTKTLRSVARQIYNNIPPIRKAVDDIAAYAVGDGWSPIFQTDNPKWNKDTADWLSRKVFPVIDVNGIADFHSILRMTSVYTDVDGDTLTIFTTSEDGKFPLIQTFMANRIASRKDKIESGSYKGLSCINGTILSKTGRPLAYNILGDDSSGLEDIQIPVNACHLNYEPITFDAVRGVTSLSPIINDIRSYKEIYECYQQIVRQLAKIPVIHTTNDPVDTLAEQLGEHTRSDTGENEPIYGKYIHNTEALLFRVGSGEKLDIPNSPKPEQNVMEFMRYLLKSAYSGLGWFYELYELHTLGGANARLVLAKAQRRIEQRQLLIYRLWKRTIQHCVATGIIHGHIPYKPKWYLCEPVLPRRVTVDYGRDTKTDIEAIKFGILSHDQVCSYEGYSSRDVLVSEAKYLSEAQEVANEHGIPVEWLVQRFPNQVKETLETPPKKEEEDV